MGEEGKIIEFESGRQTLLFWNMDDYPIPVDTTDDLGSVSSNMFEALQLMGFRGYMRMQVYSSNPIAKIGKSYSAAVYEFPDIALYIIRLTTKGIGQPSSGMPWIAHSLFLPLLMRSTTLSHQLLWKGVLDDDKKGSWRDALLGGNKEWASRIYFLPGGDNSSRRDRMLNDIYLWARDSSPRWNKRSHEASLVIFSDQFNDDSYYTHMLQKLSKRGYNLLLVTPTQDIREPESPEWPGLLIDE
ncbi:hypothetical protein Bca52824_050440 [Brassica carinata]|uniref:NYN domain-containing protein n=1 Tax=Brassica carinata TaxID=52824 RepID=A0A8X7R2F0_BRACI|nr:hypothetical protein Bca52824_050440 [Brassica carinata]